MDGSPAHKNRAGFCWVPKPQAEIEICTRPRFPFYGSIPAENKVCAIRESTQKEFDRDGARKSDPKGSARECSRF